MLEGVTQTVYGNDAAAMNRLATAGSAGNVAAAVETGLTTGSAFEFGYLVYMRADCLVAGTTGGFWQLRANFAGGVLLNLRMPVVAAPVGTSYCWPFPVPWKTPNKNDTFTIQPSVATMGTWAFIVNGFYSSI